VDARISNLRTDFSSSVKAVAVLLFSSVSRRANANNCCRAFDSFAPSLLFLEQIQTGSQQLQDSADMIIASTSTSFHPRHWPLSPLPLTQGERTEVRGLAIFKATLTRPLSLEGRGVPIRQPD